MPYALIGFLLLFANKLFAQIKVDSIGVLKDSEKLNQNNATITETQAKVIAENFHTAVMGLGTDEDLIYEQLNKLKNQNDFNAVFNAFGKRQYSQTWGNIGDPLTSDKYDLLFILANELSSNEQQYIKETYPYLVLFN